MVGTTAIANALAPPFENLKSDFQMVGVQGFISHFKNGPFTNQPYLNQSKAGLVQILDLTVFKSSWFLKLQFFTWL